MRGRSPTGSRCLSWRPMSLPADNDLTPNTAHRRRTVVLPDLFTRGDTDGR